MAKRKKSAGAVTVDFGHEEAKGGGRRNPRLPEGDYLAEILNAKQKEAESGNQMIVWQFKILGPKKKGQTITTNTVLIPKSFWVIRNLLEAIGVEVPEKAVKVAYSKYIGEKIGITLADGKEFKNRVSSEIVDFISPEQIGEEDENDEEDEDEEEDESDLDEMDRDELKAYIADNDLDVRVKKSMDEDDVRGAVQEAEAEDEDDEDEDDEDEMEEVDLDEL